MFEGRLIIGLVILVIVVLILRLVGAWMLRINDIIEELKGLRRDLRALENDYLKKRFTPDNK